MVMFRYGAALRVAMPLLLMAAAIFFFAMAVLVSHDSQLRCGAGCVHVEQYPFGVERAEPVPPITSAEAMWSPGARAMALKLVLHHPDGSRTEYQGVGQNGDRAEQTARELNAFIAHPGAEAVFPLRTGSPPIALMLVVVALGGLALAPHFFTRIKLVRDGERVCIEIGRWPARARRLERLADGLRFGTRELFINGQPFVGLYLESPGADPVALGTVTSREAPARERAARLNAWLDAP